MPSHYGVRPNDHNRVNTASPEALEQNPKASIQMGQADPRSLAALKNLQLMMQSYDLELQGSSTPKAGHEAVD